MYISQNKLIRMNNSVCHHFVTYPYKRMGYQIAFDYDAGKSV